MQISTQTLLGFLIDDINIWSPLVVLLVGLLSWRTYRAGGGAAVCERMLSWYFFLTIGMLSLQNFIMDIFFPEKLAAQFGFSASAFQYDIGTGDLMFVILGIVGAMTKSYGFRAATVIAYAIWLWSESLKHIYLVSILHSNSKYFNGPTVYLDAALPILGIILLLGSKRLTLWERVKMKLQRLLS